MAEEKLAIISANDKEVYCKDTMRIHPVPLESIVRKWSHSLQEFSLLDDASVKCKPEFIYDKDVEPNYFFEIQFTTPVPREYQYELSLYYFDKLGQLKLSNVLYAENIMKDEKFTLKCAGAMAGYAGLTNVVDGNIIFCIKICRKDTLYFSQKKPALLHSSQITDCSLLFENTALSNLTISVENKEFRVHKDILAAKSSVFLAMFQAEMKENKENYVKIEDIEEDVFQEFLRYIYTNTVNDLNTHAEKLYVVADKYDLPKLKLTCIDELSRSLNVDNAVHIFLFAFEKNVTILKERTIDFVKKHPKLILQSEDYKALRHSPKAYLIAEIFQAFVELS